MAIIYEYKGADEVEAAIWRIEEELDYFRSAMYLYEEEKDEIEGLSKRKLLEWFASRFLLHKLSGWDYRGACLKDDFGKPFLAGSGHFISLSHSNDWIAAAASLKPIGVDIQLIVGKISRIAPKFASKEELDFVEGSDYILGLHYLWGIKESIYKAYGKGNLEFKRNIKVSPFDVGPQIITTALLDFGNEQFNYNIQAKLIDNYVLVLATDNGHLP